MVFLLDIDIQHPKKSMGHFDYEEFTHQTCDFNKSLSDSIQIRLEDKRESFPKSCT